MIVLLAGLAAAACPSLDAETERATLALLGGDAVSVDAALREAEAALACAPAKPGSVARWLEVVGATRVLRGADGSAHLSAARALDASAFDPRLGPVVREAWDRAAPSGSATLLLEPPLPALVDGSTVTDWPVALHAGPHTLQVVATDGTVRFGRAIELFPGEDALVPTGLAPAPTSAAAPDGPPVTLPADVQVSNALEVGPPVILRRGRPAFLVAAGGLAATGIALGGAALAQGPRMASATDLDALDGAYAAQRGLAFGAYGAFGAAAVAGACFVVVR